MSSLRTFRQFMGEKVRESKRQLHMVKKVLENGGFKVEDFLDEEQFVDEPYIYCRNPNKDTSFEGVRLYKIGDKIAYRVQRENKTHPFGAAYLLDMDGIFNDLMSDGVTKKEKLGEKLKQEIIDNLRSFFKESAAAEREDDQWNDEEDSIGMVHVRNPLGGDYSSMVHDGGR